jgi:hypothetical protein
LVDDPNSFVCYFNFEEPRYPLLGEMVREPDGSVAIQSTKNIALTNAIIYVKSKFGFL